LTQDNKNKEKSIYLIEMSLLDLKSIILYSVVGDDRRPKEVGGNFML